MICHGPQHHARTCTHGQRCRVRSPPRQSASTVKRVPPAWWMLLLLWLSLVAPHRSVRVRVQGSDAHMAARNAKVSQLPLWVLSLLIANENNASINPSTPHRSSHGVRVGECFNAEHHASDKCKMKSLHHHCRAGLLCPPSQRRDTKSPTDTNHDGMGCRVCVFELTSKRGTEICIPNHRIGIHNGCPG
jgi:hypothetical protein